jgi:hypothetical protein
MSKKVTIALKDVELIRWRVLIITSKGPSTRRGRGVLGGEVQRTKSNS